MTINDLILCRMGTVLHKGNRKRIYLGWEMRGGLRYIIYKAPSKQKETMAELDSSFTKWLAGAETDGERGRRELMQS